MAQPNANTYSNTNQRRANKADDLTTRASDVAQDVSKEARNLVDKVVAYTKANPVEAAAIAAGVAFIAGAAILGPRLIQSREQRDFNRLIRQAYREAERVRDESSSTWSQLTDWVSKNATKMTLVPNGQVRRDRISASRGKH
jgi:ElaB/YqjD/DUF883 family membrane-anchored ribosome-binding protein